MVADAVVLARTAVAACGGSWQDFGGKCGSSDGVFCRQNFGFQTTGGQDGQPLPKNLQFQNSRSHIKHRQRSGRQRQHPKVSVEIERTHQPNAWHIGQHLHQVGSVNGTGLPGAGPS